MNKDNNNDEILMRAAFDGAIPAESLQGCVAGDRGEDVSDVGQKPLSEMDIFRKVFFQK